MTKSKGLGRGLEALFHDNDLLGSSGEVSAEYVHQLSLSAIDINKNQPRKSFNDDKLKELAASISSNGLIQPITVQQKGSRYEIVAGERRFRACKLLGLSTIPAIVKELSPRQVMELALIENLQREDLNPIEEASAMETLMHEYSLTQQELSDRLGKSRPAIANTLRLLNLSSLVKGYIMGGQLTAGHGRALAALERQELQEALAKECIGKDWTVRDIENAIKALREPKAKKPVKKKEAEFEEAENNLRNFFGTKVIINGSVKKGKIEIEYYNRDDLERILALAK